ncbi:MAG: SDR family NAD(P)-dependent oxidoreductase [Nevskia sp.]|nr:SDR family NAD(P)-dependent oxidoreductase [Nevskia sp.]
MSRSRGMVAVTGATGFLGRHVVAALAAAGWQVRILARSQPVHPLWQDLEPEVVLGGLSDADALRRLVSGADAVLHLAGLIKARNAAEFMRVNCEGSRALAAAVAAYAPGAHFLLVSSLAAREPALSGYAASKRAAEAAVFDALGRKRVSIVRPPAIYGPGDRETLVIFKLARRKRIPILGRMDARVAMIHVEDAARVLAAQLAEPPSGLVHAIADHRPDGYTWQEIFQTAALAVTNPQPRFIAVPPALTRAVGLCGGALARLLSQPGMVNAGKVRELLHRDWRVSEPELLIVSDANPKITLPAGFAATAAWYRRAGWLTV